MYMYILHYVNDAHEEFKTNAVNPWFIRSTLSVIYVDYIYILWIFINITRFTL